MPATNANIIHKAFMNYRKEIFDEVEKRCRKFCEYLCLEAIKQRQLDPMAHNFTGNLLNSIVVCLYRDREPINAYYAGQYVPKAIRVKMTARKYAYHFNPDYDRAASSYKPEVETDKGWGVNDARRFFQSYKPKGKNLFDIVIAYPVEYATWVEQNHGTTGILQTYGEANTLGVTYLELPQR